MNETKDASPPVQCNVPSEGLFTRLENLLAETAGILTLTTSQIPYTEHNALRRAFNEIDSVVGNYTKAPIFALRRNGNHPG